MATYDPINLLAPISTYRVSINEVASHLSQLEVKFFHDFVDLRFVAMPNGRRHKRSEAIANQVCKRLVRAIEAEIVVV